MKLPAIDISFEHGSYQVLFEDESLHKDFASVFEPSLSTTKQGSASTLFVEGSCSSGYNVYHNNAPMLVNSTRKRAAYCLMRVIGDNICSSVDGSTCVMHAASVLHKGVAVSFVGSSGSGKTSLSIEFSNYGRYLGDEYALIDLGKGCIWHESHPFQLKAENHSLLSRFASNQKLEVEDESFGRAYYISTNTINSIKTSCLDEVKLQTIVFPHYNVEAQGTTTNKMSAEKLPIAILESLFGKGRPSCLLKMFLRFCTTNSIKFYEIEFCDCSAAANELDVFITQERSG